MAFPSFVFTLAVFTLAANYQKSDWGWQWEQTQQRFWEWLERQLNRPSKPQPQNKPGLNLEWLAEYITWLLIGLLIMFGLVLLWQLYQAGQRWWARRQLREERTIVETPVYRTRSVAEWQQLAQQAQQRGDRNEAVRSLYFAMLNSLHERQIIPSQLSRTDGEYQQLVKPLPQSQSFQLLLSTHEQIEFAGVEVSETDYKACQNAYHQTTQITASAVRSESL
jgi:hypothetical protein